MDSAESSITPMGKPTLECAGIDTPSPGDIIFPECDQFMTPEENALRTPLTAEEVEGDEEAEPRNGMEFERHEDVYAFYNRYARRVGFGVTTVTSRTKKGAFIFFHYACQRSGQSRKKPDAMSHRDSAKTSCRASIRARVDKETNKWRLTDVEIEHNHELNPHSAIFLRSHRKICSSENADAVGDPPMSKIVSSVARRKGGISELEFREDCGNFVHRECQSQVREGDAQTMVNHFLGMQVSWHSMESGEQLHEDSNVGNHAQGHLDSTKEGSINGSTAMGTSLAENAGGGLVASANISGDRDKDTQGQPDTMKERSADGSSAAQQAVGGSAAAANIADNREKNQATPDPVVGMAFETEQAAYDCYSEYGKRNGFTVRWDNRTLSRRTGVTLARRFVCSKQGRRGDGQRRRHSLAKYHREETRCGCLAYMKIKLASDGKYRIIELNATHNHPLACQVPVNYSLANLVLYNHPLANQVPNIRPVPIQVANIRPLPNQVPNIRPVPIQVPNIRPLPNQVPNISPIPNQLPNIHPLSNQVPYNHPVAVFVPINAQVQGHPLGNKIAPNPILASPHTAHVVIMQRLPGAQAAAAKKIKRKRKSADDSDGPVAPDATSQDMDTQASSLENVGSLPADAQNYLPMKRTNVMQKFDIDGLFEYFKSKQAQNTSFFYSFQLDVDEKITNVFWMDGRMRTDYMRFGDILCFDTTYKTNDYGRPLALFVGVNHHKQTIIFGAALLYDESAYSFQWVFKTFLEAVGGKMPNTILTDESSAITSAIESEVPGIPHRLCVWHLYQNASKKLAKVFTGSKDFDDDFSRCIYDYDVEADFLEGWNAMLEKYGLVENAWLQQKFKDREKWAPVYGRSAFCADLKSAQHRERMNKELKRYLSPARDIETFLQNFDKFLEEKRNKELEANSKMTKSSPYAPPVSIIQHAARVYTSAVFDMFMTEYVAGLECLVKDRQYDGPLQILTVEDGQHHDHIVSINFDEEILSCSCCKFENVGILCGHVLTCITKKMRSIPDRYILKRWTRCAGNLSVIYHANTTVEDQRCILSQRYNSLVHDFVQLSVRAAEDEDIYNCAMKHKAAMCEEMEKVFKEKTSSLSYHLFGEHVW